MRDVLHNKNVIELLLRREEMKIRDISVVVAASIHPSIFYCFTFAKVSENPCNLFLL
jgi:hypothetical protein